MNEALRSIPKVDVVLGQPQFREVSWDRGVCVRAVQEHIAGIREEILASRLERSPGPEQIAGEVAGCLERLMGGSLRPVINASGVVVYTNLGRAPMAEEALDAVQEAAAGYSNLEYDLEQGQRGSRQTHFRELVRVCFGAPDALVVNNNAAAVMLVLAAHARGREVIISRGEQVEIGGSFRMPDVMGLSGCTMREVGTTNRTRVGDYASAINENTAMILKVHRSNFAVVGFSEEAEIAELARLAHDHDIPLFVDMGSGIPFDLAPWGIDGEWTIGSCLEAGADLVSFSGDKVLGGPQAGIILGGEQLLNAMSRHPLHRALRVDKMTIAALTATLRLLAQGRGEEIPVLQMICEGPEVVRARAETLCDMIDMASASVVDTRAVVGGGSAPVKDMPSAGVLLRHVKPSRVHRLLRQGEPAVVARVEERGLIFDCKTVREEDLGVLAELIREAAGGEKE